MQLANKEAAVVVDLPESAQSTSDAETAALKDEVQSLKKELVDLKEATLWPQQLQRKMALRRLLDAARATIAGHTLSDQERGQPWNDFLGTSQDFKGLSKEAAMLTKFGRGTQQWLSSQAGHSFDEVTIAEAITAVTKDRHLYDALFKFVYQKDAEALVFSALQDDDDD